MSQKEELVTKAEALGIDVDGRWSEETLQEKIDEVTTSDKPVKSWSVVDPEDVRKGINAAVKAKADKIKGAK